MRETQTIPEVKPVSIIFLNSRCARTEHHNQCKVIWLISLNRYESMMDAFERFGLLINDRIVRTPVAVASMAGWVDAAYVLERADHIGAAFIGGYSIDKPTMDAAKIISDEGNRKEFLYDDPVTELKKQMALLAKSKVVPGLNLRGSTPASFCAIAGSLGEQAVYEIDAHCRQPAMVAAGCGEHYLKKPGELMAVVRALKSEGVTVSVKIRAGIAADDRLLARKLWESGADILHIDLMDFGSAKIRQIRNSLSAYDYCQQFDKYLREDERDALARRRSRFTCTQIRYPNIIRTRCRNYPVRDRGGLV